MDLYYYYTKGYEKTLASKLPDFKGYPTVQSFCIGSLDKIHNRPKMTKQQFEFYLMLK